MQRTLSHSLAMSSGCKGAPSHHPTPPTSSAHTQTYNSATKHCLSRQHLAVSAFTVRLTSRSSRRNFVVRADADYGASWKDSQEAFLVLVSLFPCICSWLAMSSECPLTSHFLQGLAHCFEKDDNGKLADSFVIEPISANSLEVWNWTLGHTLTGETICREL